MLESIVIFIVNTIGQLGYPGIVAMMFLESSFFPFPSEVVIPPAGYLASQGKMNLTVVVSCGVLGSILGALFNYWVSLVLGRPFFERYGRYFLVTEKNLERVDRFFYEHGHISTFIGRLLPGIRQYISLPAGIARMNLLLFVAFTSLGAGLWVLALALVGYMVGNNRELLHTYLHNAALLMVVLSMILAVLYILLRRKIDKRSHHDSSYH